MVKILGSSYVVTLYDGSRHLVCKDRTCRVCGGACPAVDAVKAYLQNGGERAPDAFEGGAMENDEKNFRRFWTWPRVCPVCGGATVSDRVMHHRTYGAGWKCSEGGYVCLYRHRYAHLKNGWSNKPAE